MQTLAVFGGLFARISGLLWFQAAPRSRHLFTDVLFTDVLFTDVFTNMFTDVLFTDVFADVLFTDVLESMLNGLLV